ncbi:hypothetical protein V7094_25555 [Priestia megaterium]|uniref:hypothetical protein n=1 Tax=Priestia megaterium TaxID=1404 RepID=UPI002FFE2217
MDKNEEIILVIARNKLFRTVDLEFQGVATDEHTISYLMYHLDLFYKSMKRGQAEDDDRYKQPIPYIVIRRGKELFLYERLKGGGESKLHGKLSLGAGGHMNPLDSEIYSFKKVLAENTKRELEEELDISGEINVRVTGFINDDSNDVGKVHVGILGIIDLKEEDEVAVRETDTLKGSWATLEELRSEDVYNRLENWSKIVVDMM